MKLSLSILRRMRNVSETSYRRYQNTFLFSIIFSSENRTIYEIMWKEYGRAGQATDDNMEHAHLHAGYLTVQTQTQNM